MVVPCLLLAWSCAPVAPPDDDAGGDPPVDDDAVAQDDDVPVDDDAPPPAILEIGTNVPYSVEPADFTPLREGDALEVLRGGQGAWMAVAAFRTRDAVASPVILTALLLSEAEEMGRLHFERQDLVFDEDGFGYYFNLFLVVFPDAGESFAGHAATVSVTVRDELGATISGEVGVVLSGGPALGTP
jgi:hypothetical protein